MNIPLENDGNLWLEQHQCCHWLGSIHPGRKSRWRRKQASKLTITWLHGKLFSQISDILTNFVHLGLKGIVWRNVSKNTGRYVMIYLILHWIKVEKSNLNCQEPLECGRKRSRQEKSLSNEMCDSSACLDLIDCLFWYLTQPKSRVYRNAYTSKLGIGHE